jgi:hypothetical protein
MKCVIVKVYDTEFQHLWKLCAIHAEISSWPSVCYALSSINMAENWNCPTTLIQVSHSEFEDRQTDRWTDMTSTKYFFLNFAKSTTPFTRLTALEQRSDLYK